MRSELAPSPEGDQHQQVSDNNRNTAPENRKWRENHRDNAKISKLATTRTTTTTTSDKQQQQRRRLREKESGSVIEINQRIEQRSRKLTICLLSLVAAISCLSPFVSLHLTHRVGLLLFESDLIQLRSSFYSVVICLLVLVTIYLIIIFIVEKNTDRNNKRAWLLQRILKQLIGFFAIISALSYLSLALIVPQIRQIHRMPIATFDCNANLITIENCHQQFTSSKGSEQTIFEAINELISGNIDENNERLIKKLNCLKYNNKDLGNLEVPTRFLLHKCGLVCKPQRQQLHQFSDDLNREQLNDRWSQTTSSIEQQSTIVTASNPTNDSGINISKQNLVPPYINKALDDSAPTTDRHYIYHNASSPDSSRFETAKISGDDEQSTSQVSLKVCFSGEFIGGSNYKQFCITNLAYHGRHNQDQTLTIGQLNAMLKTFIPNPSQLTNADHQSDIDSTFYSDKISDRNIENSIEAEETTDQATHYVNPVVQFESHFKNWPHLPIGDGMNSEDSEDSWCKFRPIPPFIVNNKPFSDIQCSLEHEYTMTTGPSPDSISNLKDGKHGSSSSYGRTDNIYLKKASATDGANGNSIENERRERCNIQCKVNILYQVRVNKNRATSSATSSFKENNSLEKNDLHYYLPLKPCVIVSNDGDKTKTSKYYIFFRSIADSSLLLTFILLDLFILLETIDTKQFQFEAKKVRFIGIFLIITLLPLIIAILFDLTSNYYPHYNNFMSNNYVNKSRSEGYLITLINEQIVPSILDLFASSSSSMAKKKKSLSSSQSVMTNDNLVTTDLQPRQNYSSSSPLFDQSDRKKHLLSANYTPIIDNFTLPFFVYSIFMFIFAINSFLLPHVLSPAPLIRVSSTEELGMASSQKNGKQRSRTDKRVINRQKQRQVNIQKQKNNHKLTRRFIIKMISLYLICLFMGVQFNLSQHTQTQILIESFGNPAITVGQSYPSLWFTLGTHSSAAIFIFIMALIFQNELSSFFSNFSPFKTTASVSLDSYETKRNGAKFFTYLSLSLLIYSFKYFSIAGMNLRNKFKFLVVFLFQIAELSNFPITWFALTTRAHEMITEHRVRKLTQESKLNNLPSSHRNQESSTSDSKALNLHIVTQSSLVLTYFIIAKSVALFIHSIYVSLHLHSDNVDWFITSFYKPNKHQHEINSTSTSRDGAKSESLFSPLPGERQTYLHASRLFLKYNSLLCLISGIISLVVLIYFRIQIWSEQKRTADISLSHRSTDESIDERLSLDLMRIHSNSTRTIYPGSNLRRGSSSDLRTDSQKQSRSSSPRAKILFHYNLDREAGSSDSSTSSLRDRANRQKLAKPITNMSQATVDNDNQDSNFTIDERDMEKRRKQRRELRIPIQIEQTNDNQDFGQLDSSELRANDDDDDVVEVPNIETTTERIVHHRNKRVRIFEDIEGRAGFDRFDEQDEQVLHEEDVVATEPRPPNLRVYSHRPESASSSSLWEQGGVMRHGHEMGRTSHRKRSISFAPNATLIGEDGFSEHRDEKPYKMATPKRASPEPSIGENEEDYDNDDYNDSNSQEFRSSSRQPDSID